MRTVDRDGCPYLIDDGITSGRGCRFWHIDLADQASRANHRIFILTRSRKTCNLHGPESLGGNPSLEKTMKNCSLLALVGLAICFALPTFAQQTSKPDPELRKQVVALVKKYDDAINANEASAVAAVYTDDAIYLPDTGPINGREAIQKAFVDLFQKVHFSNNLTIVDENSPHIMGKDGNEIWSTGAWSATLKGENWGPVPIKGFWSVIHRRQGDDLKIVVLTGNVTPAPAATPSPTAVK
jgi:ketosteroid isomerase-like protein